MKISILLFVAMISSAAIAARDQSNDFSYSNSKLDKLSPEKLRYKFEIVGEVLVFDKSGTQLISQVPERRSWNFGSNQPITGNWNYKAKDLPEVAIYHEWDVNKEGQLTAKIIQYDKMSRESGEVKNEKLLNEKTVTIENFDSINWIVEQTDQRRVVAKFSPRLWSSAESQNLGAVAINGRDITIYDNKGDLWASDIDNTDGDNVYFGVTTHRGSVFLSYLPFKGSKEIGTANSKGIKLQDGNLKLKIKNIDPFLPSGVTAKVYGYTDLSRRTDKPFSVRSYGSNKEENFLKHIVTK